MMTSQALVSLASLPPCQVLGALREVGDQLGMAVRPYSVTPGAAFPSFVASMAQTGVLVARHGPLLANAMFLPPGGWTVGLAHALVGDPKLVLCCGVVQVAPCLRCRVAAARWGCP